MEEELTVEQLLEKLNDGDAEVRSAAWQQAGPVGAAAVRPLAKLMAEMDAEVARATKGSGAEKADPAHALEVGRAAKHALWAIVRHVGRPGAGQEKAPVVRTLCELVSEYRPAVVLREVLWMLSEIGGDDAVAAIRGIPGILENTAIREDARCAVERIPGEMAVSVLWEGLEASTDDFRLALAHSLRVRGQEVDKKRFPPQKLLPTRHTEVQPAS